MKEDNVSKLKNLLQEYSFEDLVKSFFVLSMWLPNVSSLIKSQYLYIVLEAIHNQLSNTVKINNYAGFKSFVSRVIPLVPSFTSLEDYIPENDWGEIKYFSNESFYKIFYGGDVENTYDYIYAFEVIHYGFKDFYLSKLGRSPEKEFLFFLSIQNAIIEGIPKDSQDFSEVEMKGFKIPSETFWNSTITFLDNYLPTDIFEDDLISEYCNDLDTAFQEEMPSYKDFVQNAFQGKNCFYFFVKKGQKIFPVLPRKHFSILYDKWGRILDDNKKNIEVKAGNYSMKIGLELCRFLTKRVKEKELFCFGSAIKTDMKFHEAFFTSIFRSKDRLILIHVLPPPINEDELQKALTSCVPKLQEAQELLSKSPTTLGLIAENKIIQFQQSGSDTQVLRPLILTILPSTRISRSLIIEYPQDLPGEIICLDQVLGLVDEIESLEDFADFFDYLEELRSNRGFSFSSILDQFGSFKDSHGVLIEGANSPDMLILDAHWGSSFRYTSLAGFWDRFPEENFFNHPRSWFIDNKSKKEGFLMLKSRIFFGYAYYLSLNNSVSIFTNSPIDLMNYDQARVVDAVMYSLIYSFNEYEAVIKDLPFTREKKKIRILFFPSSLV
jgi:hypothetical protein